jgi:aspartate 4-decarboxylase
MLCECYRSLALDPHQLRFIDRVVADSRSVALNDTAGLSTPQRVQMALFALFSLIDPGDRNKHGMQRTIGRVTRPFIASCARASEHPNAVYYYKVSISTSSEPQRYGRDFVERLLRHENPLEILFRLADEGDVVSLPGKGFRTPHPSARISLAGLRADRTHYPDHHAGMCRRISKSPGRRSRPSPKMADCSMSQRVELDQ